MAIEKLLGMDWQEAKGHNVILALIVSVLLFLAMSLFLVWLNTERTKLSYHVRQLQMDVDARTELNAKLGVERDHLLSPYILGQRAEKMGLHTAKPGQIRRMDAEETEGNNQQK